MCFYKWEVYAHECSQYKRVNILAKVITNNEALPSIPSDFFAFSLSLWQIKQNASVLKSKIKFLKL
jgi:hypothetical protein